MTGLPVSRRLGIIWGMGLVALMVADIALLVDIWLLEIGDLTLIERHLGSAIGFWIVFMAVSMIHQNRDLYVGYR